MRDLASPIVRALIRLGWTRDDEQSLPPWHFRPEDCLLRSLAASEWLSAVGRAELKRLCDANIELRCAWPRAWKASLSNWIGNRLFLAHARNFSYHAKYSAIVSSALGRHGSRLPDWPHLMDLALQSIVRSAHTLLVVPSTTTSVSTLEFAGIANLACVKVRLSTLSDMESWVRHNLQALQVSPSGIEKNSVLVSPAAGQGGCLEAPLQDRLAIGLSDSVVALSARPGGNIFRLLHTRLDDKLFPIGSVSLALPERSTTKPVPERVKAWLERGAVGWYVPSPLMHAPAQLSLCKDSTRPFTQQICNPLSSAWRVVNRGVHRSNADGSAASAWPWLVHCTRGTSGPMPEESDSQYRQRLWQEGVCGEANPLLTLSRIVRRRILLGTSRITRTSERSLSFSAVPLMDLLARRQFRSHLGRWDWEPYGLLIRRTALQSMGGRPVIYGDARDYSRLPAEDRAFFQPTDGKQDWSAEREWRLLGDLKLDEIAPAILVFVRTEIEARQLSRYSRWPVVWVDA